jgi:hypothetical protein
MDAEVARAQLFDGAHRRKDQTVCLASPRAFAVNRLRRSDDDLLDGQIFVADHFEHLRRAETVDAHVL